MSQASHPHHCPEAPLTFPQCRRAVVQAWKAIGTTTLLNWSTMVWFFCACSICRRGFLFCFANVRVLVCKPFFTCWNITLTPERTPRGPCGPPSSGGKLSSRTAPPCPLPHTPHRTPVSFPTIYSGWEGGEAPDMWYCFGGSHILFSPSRRCVASLRLRSQRFLDP